MNSKFKCIVCCTILSVIVIKEALNLTGEDGKHLDLWEHAPEKNFQINMPEANIINISRTASVSNINTPINLTFNLPIN